MVQPLAALAGTAARDIRRRPNRCLTPPAAPGNDKPRIHGSRGRGRHPAASRQETRRRDIPHTHRRTPRNFKHGTQRARQRHPRHTRARLGNVRHRRRRPFRPQPPRQPAHNNRLAPPRRGILRILARIHHLHGRHRARLEGHRPDPQPPRPRQHPARRPPPPILYPLRHLRHRGGHPCRASRHGGLPQHLGCLRPRPLHQAVGPLRHVLHRAGTTLQLEDGRQNLLVAVAPEHTALHQHRDAPRRHGRQRRNARRRNHHLTKQEAKHIARTRRNQLGGRPRVRNRRHLPEPRPHPPLRAAVGQVPRRLREPFRQPRRLHQQTVHRVCRRSRHNLPQIRASVRLARLQEAHAGHHRVRPVVQLAGAP